MRHPTGTAVAVGCAVIAFWLAIGSGARAQPRVHFDVHGDCPSGQDVASAFGAQVLSAASEQGVWRVEVRGSAEGAALTLHAPEGAVVSTRTIESNDCNALAQAFALIVLAHFVELRLIDAPVAEPVPEPEPTRAAPVAAAEPAGTAQQLATAPDRALGLGVALGAGLGLGVAPSSAAPALDLSLGLGPRDAGWRARLAAQLTATVRHESTTDRIEHWRTGARLELGGRLRLTPAVWGEAAAGGGVTLARVTALDLPEQPATTRLWPALSASLALGVELGPAWSLRWATAAQLYPRTDRYRVEPEGVVAKSPKADVMTTLGLQFDALL
jgi:hypothetical protein